MLRDQRWRSERRCRLLDPDRFSVLGGRPGRRVRDARAVCWGCPVLVDCMDDAIADPYDWASVHVRAALTPEQRRTIRARHKNARTRPHVSAQENRGESPSFPQATRRSMAV